MSTEDNKAMTRRFINDAFNHGELGGIDKTHASDWVLHTPGADVVGGQGMKELVMLNRNAFPDYNCTIDDQIAEGDRVVTRWTMHGTHDGDMMGIPATGKKVTMTGVAIDRFSDGKFAEAWLELDMAGLLQQMGVLPSPQGATA